MTPSFLAMLWFWLIGVLFILYSVFDGFDIGAAAWYLFAPPDERSRILTLIGPLWDGNEVWLLAAGGGLFAAFPAAYASVFSGFYLPVMLVVAALICRAAAFEFRYLLDHPRWNPVWDVVFVASSLVAPLVLGVAAGNLLMGVPLDSDGNYAGTLPGLFSHYTLAAGLIAVCMFATHGSLFIAMKTDGTLRKRAAVWAFYSVIAYLILFFDLTVWSIGIAPHISTNFTTHAELLLVPIAGLTAIAAIPIFLKNGRFVAAFASSTISIVALLATFGISLYPFLVPTFGNPGADITIANAASSERTLGAMLVIALIGLPVVFVYTAYLYRVFGVPKHADGVSE